MRKVESQGNAALGGMWKTARALFGVGVGLGMASLAASPARADMAMAWGYNSSGQLGNGTKGVLANASVPVEVTGLSSGVSGVAAGAFYSLAIQNGAVLGWGHNYYGQLGNGANGSGTDTTLPVAVSGLTSGVSTIAGGGHHSLAIQNGKVWAWGDNYYGELGNGSTSNSNVPVPVSGLSSGVTAIAGGTYHSLAIQNGAVKAWGSNVEGELGNGTNGFSTNSSIPVTVTGLDDGVTAIAAGYTHCLAVQNGKAWAWGYNVRGQLGNGSTTDSALPVAVSGLSSGVSAIAGGNIHSLAIQNGNVWAWGDNGYGQLGDGTTTNKTTPVLALDLPTVDLVAVAASGYSSFALSADGSLWVWGENGLGGLGLGDTGADYYTTPQHLLAPAGYKFTSIEADGLGDHTLATLAPVPEPASLSLVVLAGACLLRRRQTGIGRI